MTFPLNMSFVLILFIYFWTYFYLSTRVSDVTANSHGTAYPYDVTVTRRETEGFGFVIISSVTKSGSTLGEFIGTYSRRGLLLPSVVTTVSVSACVCMEWQELMRTEWPSPFLGAPDCQNTWREIRIPDDEEILLLLALMTWRDISQRCWCLRFMKPCSVVVLYRQILIWSLALWWGFCVCGVLLKKSHVDVFNQKVHTQKQEIWYIIYMRSLYQVQNNSS